MSYKHPSATEMMALYPGLGRVSANDVHSAAYYFHRREGRAPTMDDSALLAIEIKRVKDNWQAYLVKTAKENRAALTAWKSGKFTDYSSMAYNNSAEDF